MSAPAIGSVGVGYRSAKRSERVSRRCQTGPVRRRIVLFAAGTALLAVVLLAVPLGILASRGYLRDERLELQQAAATAAARARGDIASVPVAPHVPGGEIRVSVYDRNGRRVSGPGPTTAPALIRQALAGRQATTTTDSSIAVSEPVADGDQVVAALLLTTSLDAVHQRALHAWLGLAGMALGAVVVSGFGAWLLARRLTRPIDRLTAVATQLGSGDLSARAPMSGVGEVDALGDTLNTTVERVEHMITRERAFSTEVSHQLRTPLSGLRLDLETARGTVPSDSAGGRALDQSLAAVDRLEVTIAEVIRLARDLPAGHRVEIKALLDGLSGRWRGQLAGASRPLRVVTDPDVPAFVAISAAAAAQILDILLDNACRHGRGAVTVTVGTSEHDTGGDAATPTVGIEVSDEGPALTVEAWQLFRRRNDADESTSGQHGIGLPYARRLAETEGARVVLARTAPPTFALIVAAVAADAD
jgi:signal transduction histidine kinase